MTKPKKFRCLNFVPLKSLEKEGLEARLIGTKRFSDIIKSREDPLGQLNWLVDYAEKCLTGAILSGSTTNPKGYRSYWSNISYHSDWAFEPTIETTYGTLTIKLYELKKIRKK